MKPLRIPPRKRRWSDAELSAWTAEHPVGTRVRYWPIRPDRNYPEETEDHVIRSEPWRLGHGDPVVLLVGKPGGVALDHLRKVPTEEPSRDCGNPYRGVPEP